MAADVNMVGIAIYGDANMTETSVKIRINTAADGTSFSDTNLKRTITTTNIVAAQWNYILFPATLGRYLQIYGASGSSLVLSFAEIKVRKVTDAVFTLGHKHKSISTSDTSMALSA